MKCFNLRLHSHNSLLSIDTNSRGHFNQLLSFKQDACRSLQLQVCSPRLTCTSNCSLDIPLAISSARDVLPAATHWLPSSPPHLPHYGKQRYSQHLCFLSSSAFALLSNNHHLIYFIFCYLSLPTRDNLHEGWDSQTICLAQSVHSANIC